MKQRIVSILLHPYIIALYITAVIIYFLPNYFSKYKIDTEIIENLNINNSKLYYFDLDSDGKKEKIIAQTNTLGNASYLLYNSNGDFVDQFNLRGKFPTEQKNVWFSDINKNNSFEISAVTQVADSALLNVYEPFKDNGINEQQIYVDTISKFNTEYNFAAHKSVNLFGNSNLKNDIIFSINTGFAANPRHIYKYNFNLKTILKSSHLVNSSIPSNVYDIDDDEKNEVFINNYASNNIIDSKYTKRSDESTWLMVLEDDLSFMFPPIEFKATGSISTLPIKLNNSTKILALFKSRQYEKFPSKLLIVNQDGVIEKERIVKKGSSKYLLSKDNNHFLVADRSTGEVIIYDKSLSEIEHYNINPFRFMDVHNIDQDNNNEFIVFRSNNSEISIYKSEFNNEVTLTLLNDIENNVNSGVKQINASSSQLYFQKGAVNQIFNYAKNPLNIYQYFMYLGIYLSVLVLIQLIIKGQKLREAKKRAIEAQISELQIKTIKNQVDSHFVFNAINTISEMTLMDNKLEADKFISRFSIFMRDTLQHSDKIVTTLEEELVYIENFIKLQQIRFNNKFTYKINISNTVQTSIKVPKHILFTYVENAIKHGLSNKKDGALKINVNHKKERLLLSIEDNGLGIDVIGTPKKGSTGNGLLIMQQIFDLYSKLNKKKISHRFVELKDKNNQKCGVRVEVEIFNKK